MTPDIYSLLMAEQEPDAKAQAAAMSEALRRNRGMGGLALLTGDKVLGNFGQALLGQAGQQEGMLAQAGGQRSGQRLREMMAAQQAAQAKAKADLDGQRRLDDRAWREKENALGRQSNERAAAIAAGNKAEADTLRHTQQFGDEVVKSGAPGFYERFDDANAILKRYAGKDVPGFGKLAGAVPDWALDALPGIDESSATDARALRQSIGQLLSEYRKGQTGAGMSDSERTEYGAITGLLNRGDEKSLRMGLERLGRAMDARLRATAGGFKPEAVRTYSERVPRVGKALGQQPDVDLSAPPAPAPRKLRRVTMPDGTVWEEMPDGSARQVR